MTNESKLREALASILHLADAFAAGPHGMPMQQEAVAKAGAALALPMTAPGAEVPSDAVLAKVCDLLRIGALARSESTILTNVRNAVHFSALLHAVENDLFPKPDLPDDDDPYAEVAEDLPAPNSWAAKDPADYVAQFRAALLSRFGAQPAAATHQQGLQVAEGVVSDGMVDAYLAEQRRYVEEVDNLWGRPNVGGLHTNTVREACRSGITAALAAAPSQSPAPLPEAQPVSDNGAVRPMSHSESKAMDSALRSSVKVISRPAQAHGKSEAAASFFRNGFVSARSGEHSLISANADGSVTIAAEGYALVPIEHYEKLPGSYLALAASPVSQAGAKESQPVAQVEVVVPHLRSIVVRHIDGVRHIEGAPFPAVGTQIFAAPVPKAPDAEKDAARYRWLRDDPAADPCYVVDSVTMNPMEPAEMDAAIDAALQAEAQKTGGAA